MRLIFLSWAYPPMAYPRAIQVQRLTAHVNRRPLQVYCLAPDGDRVMRIRDVSSGIDVVRIPRALPTRMMERSLPARRRGVLREYDVRYLWWRLAARHVIASGAGADDVLVTFGQPMVDHLAGLAIKRRTGIRWIAHFSDPWSDNPFDPKGHAARGDEAAVIEAADTVIFTSQETADLVMAKYPAAWRTKAAVLPHGFDRRLYAAARPSGPEIVVRYLGNMFAGRGPDALLQALVILQVRARNLLANVCFEFIGEASEEARHHPLLAKLPAQCVRFVAKVGHVEAMALMASADLLLNIDAPADVSVFLPSKLVEYVGAGRPIFGITPEGTGKRLIDAIGGWTANPGNPSDIADRLADALAHVARHRGAAWGDGNVRQTYEASHVAAAFERIVDALAKDRIQ